MGAPMGEADRAVMRLLPWLYALPANGLRWFLLAMTLVVVAWAGRGIYSSAISALVHGTTNMNTLVSLGTGVAFAYSAYATIAPAPGRQVYFDAVLLIVGFLLLGKSLEARAKRRALSALDSLSRLRPVNARRIVDGVETVVPSPVNTPAAETGPAAAPAIAKAAMRMNSARIAFEIDGLGTATYSRAVPRP